jgi:ABC-type nitrate/sulfonate/bicarbonate transport system ATPase subunit
VNERRLEVRGLTKVFGNSGRAKVALEGIDLHAGHGEFVCVVGTSGCGKSTLLSIAAGLTPPTAGEVFVDGRPVEGPGPDRGLVFQAYSLYPWRTVAENVAFGLELGPLPKSQIRERVGYYLDVMQLGQWADARPAQLSGGMRQRVAIARSLATEPEVLLLDEPFGALDPQTKSRMHEFLQSVWERTGVTILMVTHDVEEAIYLAQRIYVFSSHPGRVKAELSVPFAERAPALRREHAFLDMREEIHQLLMAEVAEV